jgi:hypothetical protein
MLVEDRSKHSQANKASRQEVFRSRYSTVVPLLCQFVEGWLLQVGPDSVFEVNGALWDIELAVQVKRFCEEESLAGSHPRQDNVNPISTFVIPLVDN